MGMNTDDFEPMLLHNGLDGGSVLVPDAETCRRATHIGPVRPAGAETGVEADAEFLTRQMLAKIAQLHKRTGVECDAGGVQSRKILRKFLGGQGNLAGGDAGLHGPFDLKAGTGVKMEAQAVKQTENIAVGQGLYGVARRQAEGVWKMQNLLRSLREARLVVDIHRCPEPLGDFSHGAVRKKAGRFSGLR